MIAHARTVPDTSGADLQWRQGSGLDLPLGEGEFDAVFCQQGLQFFANPAAGIREMARVARPGGRIGLTVWSPSEGSPFLDREKVQCGVFGSGLGLCAGPLAAHAPAREVLIALR